jgi:hypothetical protein
MKAVVAVGTQTVGLEEGRVARAGATLTGVRVAIVLRGAPVRNRQRYNTIS